VVAEVSEEMAGEAVGAVRDVSVESDEAFVAGMMLSAEEKEDF